ncbi:zinc-binding alcohol dehydrogenase family protein [Pseudoduganella ginsengisoli]|uniref:Zinc-binding dehydrogenase n=1 Tax=Pseudoduganella ginsengisoli TaxID=1462440 RepID=A0A6L6Q7F2_9BURK|nr:zinc-binding dehydrogenase [Pseudoduganella ginsengisoli]MTW05570.1 zinc-binding dehydrogenase [Pseudoduganella ginsengisoli]
MRAIVRHQFGGPEVLIEEERPRPRPEPGQVLIQVQAFGLNHAELYMRRGEWGDVAPVSGIECAGTVVEDPDGVLAPGQTVLAAMGGMGRTMAGSYAQYVVVRRANVVPVASDLPWDRLAMLPESYGVAWSCLQQCLNVQPGQRLLVRGASSALGRAALDLATMLGVRAIGTTRSARHVAGLQALGAERVLIAGVPLSVEEAGQFDAVLDLLGNSALRDSLRLAAPGGRVCVAGFLAGLAPVEAFNPLADMPSTVQLSFFGSFNFGAAGHPMDAIPYQHMADAMADGRLRGTPARTFPFSGIQEAHALMERNQANGKLVVRLDH